MKKTHLASTNRKQQAVTTTIQARTPIFAPIKQLSKKTNEKKVLQTQWGTVEFLKNNLTQVHRDILDCIFTFYEARHENEDGSVSFIISIPKILKKLGTVTHNYAWFISKLKELHDTMMVIKSKDQTWSIHTGIVRKWKYSQVQKTNAKHLFGEGYYFGIIIESEYMQIFRTDMNVHTEKLTSDILSLDRALIKALVRFCLSHNRINMRIETALLAVGVKDISERHRRRIIKNIQDYAETLKNTFGILISDTHISYRKHANVWFEHGCQ